MHDNDKPLPKYLDPKTVLIYRPHPVCNLNLLLLRWGGGYLWHLFQPNVFNDELHFYIEKLSMLSKMLKIMGIGPWTLTVYAWRLRIEPWWVCRSVPEFTDPVFAKTSPKLGL